MTPSDAVRIWGFSGGAGVKFCHSPYAFLVVITAPSQHTHPFNGPLSGTTQASQYQKGKTNLDFTEARDSGWQWHQLGHNASLHLAPDRQPHQHPTTLMFSYRPHALPAAQPTMPKHWRQFQSTNLTKNWMDSKPLCQHPSDNSLLWHQYPTVLLDLCTSQNLISFK